MKKRIIGVFLAALLSVTSMSAAVPAFCAENVQNVEQNEDVILEESAAELEEITEQTENDEKIPEEEPVAEESGDSAISLEEESEVISFPEENWQEEDAEVISKENSVESSDVPEDFSYMIFNEENAEVLQADTPEEEELLEEIEEGTIIALAPVANLTLTSAASIMAVSDDASISRAATSSFRMNLGAYLVMDEVWVNGGTASDHNGTAYREIVYTDDEGVTHKSPLYCMNASKNGLLDSEVIKEEAIKVLSSSNIKKILYYGYGGPGDISGSYDPTCSDCDWSKWQNRFVLTHFALSKVYADDVAGATAAECEHVGLNRWINKLTSLAIPNVKDLKFSGTDTNGDTVSAKNMTGNLTFWRVVPESLNWTGFSNGVQISGVYTLTSGLDTNGIKITRKSTDKWVLGYWNSAQEYKSRGLSDPNVLSKSGSVTLKKGAKIRFAFPYDTTANQKFTYTSILKPVQYIAISSSVQSGQSNMQDLGTYYYEGERESLSLTFKPSPSGTVVLNKTADQDDTIKIAGAGYRLFAAENIVSNGKTVLKKDEKVDGAYTDENGTITFSYIPVGTYYLMEVKIKTGSQAADYLLDVEQHSVTVVKNTTKTITVREIPDLRGRVSIRKIIEGTDLNLTGARFTLYTWSESSGKYTSGVNLTYNETLKRYESESFVYTADNQGRFKVKETKNPTGFTGTFSRELQLTRLGQEEVFEYTVENRITPRRVEIIKLDAKTKETLPDAEFTIYEWNQIRQAYETTGKLLTYVEEDERYYSEELKITDLNLGRYKVVETKVPEGYLGTFEQEIDLNRTDEVLQYTVENTPEDPITGRIRIKKTDAVTGAVLEDAGFTIYQYNTQTGKYENTLGEKAELVYDKKSELYLSRELTINKINTGKFKVIETKMPEGYTGSWQQEFVLTQENPEPEVFAVVNEPDRPPLGEITVVKKIKEEEIIWAHGDPVFLFVVEGSDTKGNKRKYENFIRFSQDGYTVDEDGYAVMQITFRNVPVGQYQVYEKPVLYYYLEKVSADTANASVLNGAEAAYGKTPKETACGIVQLTAAEDWASLTFFNKKARYDRYVHNDVIKNIIPSIFP